MLKGEKVLGSIVCEKLRAVGSRSRSLYLTQKRMIVARTGISILWWLLMLIPMSFGTILFCWFFAEIMMETFAPPTVGQLLPPIIAWLIEFPPSIGWYALALIVFPTRFLQYLTKRKIKKINELSPENILTNNKKNFQIPYEDITQIEMYSKRVLLLSLRIKMLTKNRETYEFFMGKKQFNESTMLVRSVLRDKIRVY